MKPTLNTILSRNMLLNYIGKPSLYLPACMMVWGTISILTGKLLLPCIILPI